MKTLIYNDVIEDIKKRMNDFDSKRFIKNIDFKENNIISVIDFKKADNTVSSAEKNSVEIVEKGVENKSEKLLQTEKSILSAEKKPDIISKTDKTAVNIAPVKKPVSGIFKSISDFFTDDPKAVEAAKKKAEEKRLLEIKVNAEKRRIADEKVALAKKIADEKKLAENQKKQERIRLEEERILLEKKLIEEKRLADIEKKLAKLKKN